jgi:hypothetical protein
MQSISNGSLGSISATISDSSSAFWKDYTDEAALDNITGVGTAVIVGTNEAVGTSFEDIWGPGAMLTYPTGAETWEVVSSSGDDTSAGSGVRTLSIITLDGSYDITAEQTVIMDGVTPVALTGTHLRLRAMQAATIGSGGVAAGIITLRVSGGGVTRSAILAGGTTAFDSHYTVPNGKIAVVKSFQPFIPKNEDISVRLRTRFEGADKPFLTGGLVPLFQQPFDQPLNAGTAFPEKTDIHFEAKSLNPSVTVTTVLQLKEYDSSLASGFTINMLGCV